MEIYKIFFIKTLILMLIVPVLITIFTLFVSNYFIGKSIIRYGESQMIYQWTTQKKKAAKDIYRRNKIVFLSGSNTLYGINAKKIEKETGIPTLNYGSHAGLGTYIFYDVKRILKPKDIVFIPLEYNFYNNDYETNCLPSTLIEYTISYDNEYYRQLPLMDKLKVLGYLIRLDSVMAIGKTIDRNYQLSSRGDIIDNICLDETYAKNAKPEEININKLSDNYEQWVLYKFIQWCKENDIKVYAFAPVCYHKPTATVKEKESFEQIKKFYDLTGVKFIGKFEDGFYDLKYFHNTNYHLNQVGQNIRTNYFIKKIKQIY